VNGHPLRWWPVVLGMAILGPGSPATAQDDPNVVAPPGVQVLTRGPVHEAFAEPVIYDPKPGPVVPKAPPGPVEEMPPDQKPEGANVQWIPGYWAWDDDRNDFIWVSGLWRDIPPGRQWVPGYWAQADGGFRWVPGFWTASGPGPIQYLPPPPASLDVGPNTDPPAPDAIWSPGTWVWQDNRYVWRPGSWISYRPDWVWVPPHYVSTPGGYAFTDGYWDYPLAQRGQPFAPVYFQQPLYSQPNFAYTPTVGLLAASLVSSLFVRPSYHQYYFGDYYAPNYFQGGIYPWYSFHQSRYGYDPLFAQYAAPNLRRDPNWINELHQQYQFRREHPEARPARTFEAQRTVVARPAEGVAPRPQDLVLARPIHQIATAPNAPARFVRVDPDRLRAEARQAAELRQFREARLRHEAEALRSSPAGEPRPRPIELPRSPIAGAPLTHIGGETLQAPQTHEHARGFPPPMPRHPEPNFQARPPAAGALPQRHEPHLNQIPPVLLRHQEPSGRPSLPKQERRR
jgi:hypothetical protein